MPAIYLAELEGRRLVSRLKWLVSTCIVGAAGLCIIGVVMYTSMNMEDGSGMVASFKRAGLAALKPKSAGQVMDDKAAALGQKTDRVKITAKGLTTRHIIHDSIMQRRASREFIQIKPYARVVASLATARPESSDAIPLFNPFDLYANNAPIASRREGEGGRPGDNLADNSLTDKSLTDKNLADKNLADKNLADKKVETRLIELAGGFLPEEDGQNLGPEEAERLVAEADAAYAEGAASLKPSITPDGDGAADEAGAAGGEQSLAAGEPQQPAAPAKSAGPSLPKTTVIAKRLEEDEETDENNETRSVIVQGGETLINLLKAAGAEAWQASAIAEAMTAANPKSAKLRPGQELRFTLAPAASNPAVKEPVKVSLFTASSHEATIARNAAGEYVTSNSPVVLAAFSDDEASNYPQRANVYTSVYHAALTQDLSPEFITKFLRIHCYDVDFKNKVQPGDGFELFFDVNQDDSGAEKPGELLFAAMTAGGETRGYYRFRTPEGLVDYYDDRGSNSKKFLMRTPVKAGQLTSGFGYRRHPLLGGVRMHTGVDWSAPPGTPIMAAGNGVVEAAGREGNYGNYVRIRHGNGYKTAYGHLSRFAPGMRQGVKVRQGQIIGYVGATGLSSGPHLHYEVLINNRHVNPVSIQVPRSRQLQGRLLADFKKERARIDELMRRAPVKTRIAAMEK